MAYWEIEPHKDKQYDVCILPANTNEDHQRAREYAHEVLDDIWDQLEEGQEKTVTLKLIDGDMPKLYDIDED